MTIENNRVYELAKEYEMSNKDFIEYLDKNLNIKVKSHSSNLTPAQIDKIKASFNKGSKTEAEKKPKAFIIKKAKAPAPEQPATVEVKKEEKTTPVIDKKEVKQPEVSAQKPVEQPQAEVKKEEEKPAVPQIRSLLEYNNRNSQKKRQEMMAAEKKLKKQTKDNNNEVIDHLVFHNDHKVNVRMEDQNVLTDQIDVRHLIEIDQMVHQEVKDQNVQNVLIDQKDQL